IRRGEQTARRIARGDTKAERRHDRLVADPQTGLRELPAETETMRPPRPGYGVREIPDRRVTTFRTSRHCRIVDAGGGGKASCASRCADGKASLVGKLPCVDFREEEHGAAGKPGARLIDEGRRQGRA